MPGTIVVVIVLATGEAHCMPADAAVAAMRGRLAPGDQVLVREVDAALGDVALVGLRASTGARAVVEIAWSHPQHEAVHLHVAAGKASDFADRDLSFGAGDVEAERGRTVGLVLTSMLQGAAPNAASPPAPSVAAPSVDPKGALPSARPRPVGFALDLAGHGLVGVDAPGVLFGARLGAGLLVDEWLFRASFGLSIGRVASADADATWGRFGFGAAGSVVSGPSLRVAVGFDLGVGREWLERTSVAGPTTRARWVVDATPYVHVGWALGPRLFVVTEVGPSIMLPRSRVRVGEVDAGTLPVVAGSMMVGLRLQI